MKVGYLHYDGGSGSNLPFKQAKKENYNNKDTMYEGGPNATLHVFGASSIPLNSSFDYNQVDCDVVYFWLQGGVGPEFDALRKFRQSTDAVFVLFFDDIYWLDNFTREHYFKVWQPIINEMDVLTNGYIGDDKRLTGLGKPWRYLPFSHDIRYYKKYFRKREEKEDSFFAMIHGRMTKCQRTMLIYKALHDYLPQKKYYVHPYRFYTKEQVLKQYPLDFIEFTPVVDDWFELLRNQRVQIDEYPCQSQSQVATQAACTGTVTIGHKYNAPVLHCFPKLTFDINNWQEWVRGAMMLETPSIYDAIQKYAYDAVEEYNFENFRKRLTSIYEEFKK